MIPILLGIVYLGCLVPLARLESLRADVGLTMLCGLIAAVPFVLLLERARRGAAPLLPLVVTGVVARLLLLLPAEGLSDDLYRYQWEGRVWLAGENPYELAPDDPALADLRDAEVWPRVTHRDVPAAYPPLTQAFFALCALGSVGARGFRVALVLVDLLTWFALARLMRARGEPVAASIGWGLMPLVVLEVAGSGHFDVLAVLGTVLAFLCHAQGRDRASAVLLALATLAKPYAPILLPFLLRRGRVATQLGLFAAVVGVGILPFVAVGGTTGGLARYALEWSHNAALFPSVHAAAEWTKEHAARFLESRAYSQETRDVVYDLNPNVVARAILFLGVAGIVAFLWARRGDPVRRALLALAAFLVFAPTAHPWYLLWFVPFLAVAPSVPLLLWTSSVLLSYHVLTLYDVLGTWGEERLLRAAEYAPLFLGFAAAAWIRGVRPPRAAPPASDPHRSTSRGG